MWKSLRIGALLALAALGALKLAQYAAARGQMERLAGALAPAMKLSYADVSGALDGRITLESPRLEVMSGPARGAVIRADRATIESSGALWMLARIVTGEAAVPSALDVHLSGAAFSQEDVDRYAREGWFGASSLVPFESVGCDPVSAFSPRDYTRMGMAPRPREDDLRYAYDATARTLRADVVSTASPFSTISAHLELSAFDPMAWFGSARAAKAQRIEQFSLTYLDGGYLAKRNRFCAQLTGTDAAGYAARHVAAVKTFLDARGVGAGDEVAALYRKLVAEGGSIELSSLPEAAFVPADYATFAPEDLLRQLNVTMRGNTAPPILMRLAFTTPSSNPVPVEEGEAVAVADTVPVDETIGPPAPEQQLPAVPPPLRETPKSEGLPLLSVANAAVVPIEAPRVELPPAPPPSTGVLAVATPPIETDTVVWTTDAHPSVDPRDAAQAIPASAPPPPADSIAALVWRAPTIERLPEKPATVSEYVSIPTGSLGSVIGSRVRLTTAGGKRVEGRIRTIDAGDIVVQIVRDGGTAEMHIPWNSVRDAKVRRAVAR